MAIYESTPPIVTNGLVLALDAANPRSYIDITENLVAYSEQFDNAYWTKSNSSIGPNATVAPDGTTTADKLIDNTTNITHYVRLALNNLTNSRYTVSVYAKAAEHSYLAINGNVGGYTWISFNLSNGTIVYTENANAAGQIESVGNGWYRCSWSSVRYSTSLDFSFSTSPISGGFGQFTFIGDGASGLYIWGAQLQKGSTVNPYYATTNLPRTTWTDLSGNNTTGSMVNNPTYTSINGGSFVFNGSNQWVKLGTNTLQLTNLTLSTWFNTNTISGLHELIAKEGCYKYRLDGSGFTIGLATGTPWNFVAGNILTGSVSPGQWYNAILTVVSNGAVNFYLNGVLRYSNTIGFTIGFNANEANVAAYSDTGGTGELFSGLISIAQVYNRALSAAEVLQNYNALKNRFNLG